MSISREAKPNEDDVFVSPLTACWIGDSFSRPQPDLDLASPTSRVKCMLASLPRISSFSSRCRIASSTSRHPFLPIRDSYSATSSSRLFRSTSVSHAQAMLTKALQHQQPAPSAKQHSLSQTQLPSGSPLSRPDLHSNGSRHKQPQLASSLPKVHAVLKPAASSVLNGPGIGRTIGANNLAKRGLSQTKDLESAFSSYTASNDSSRTVSFSESQSHHSVSGQVANLHDAVYFDENDFDDDADLDLEVEDPIKKGDLSVAKTDINWPVEQDTPSSNIRGITTSSAPLAWSSSPLQHKATPPNAGLLRRTYNTHAVDVTEAGTATVIDPDSEPRPSKRGILPWHGEGGRDVTKDSKNGPPAHVKKIVDRHRANRAQRQQDNGEFTPLPKDGHQIQYAWNTTASGMKEEQKKLRQANKRHVKSNDASTEDKKEAFRAKKRQKLESVFLSEEQQRVLKLVVESGKSAFFTGSAGMSQCQCKPSGCSY